MLVAMRAAVLSIALAACRASQPSSPPVSNRATAAPVDAAVDVALGGGAAAITRLERFAEDMCRCPDRDCADRVVDEMTQWAQDLAQGGAASPKVSSAEDQQARAAADRVSRCMSDVYRRQAGSAASP
jgi:hypothetical protein